VHFGFNKFFFLVCKKVFITNEFSIQCSNPIQFAFVEAVLDFSVGHNLDCQITKKVYNHVKMCTEIFKRIQKSFASFFIHEENMYVIKEKGNFFNGKYNFYYYNGLYTIFSNYIYTKNLKIGHEINTIGFICFMLLCLM
jgi:hypothetical protein